jgi:diguanylate cyclase (GGDEF)-like protein/PAS domain S-box-containing protein
MPTITPFWPFTLILILTGGIAWALAVYLWKRRNQRGTVALIFILIGAGIWCFLYSMEVFTYHIPLIKTMAKLEYFSITTIPVLWFLFAIAYTNQDKWLKRKFIPYFFIIPGILVAFVLTNDWHGLVWTNIYINSSVTPAEIIYQHGLVFWLLVVHDYVLMLAGTLVMVSALIRYPGLYRRQIGALLIASVIPWLGNAAFIFNLELTFGLDFTPIAFVISCAMFAGAIFRYRLFDLVPVARERILESMSEGVVVLDSYDRVVDMNFAARKLLGVDRSRQIGLTPDVLFHNWKQRKLPDSGDHDPSIELQSMEKKDRYIEAKVSSLVDWRGKFSGKFMVLNDISTRKIAEKREQEERVLAEAFRDSIAAVTSSLDQDEIFNKMLQYVRRVVPHDASTIATLDESGIARFPYQRGYAERGYEADIRNLILDPREMPHWKVMLESHQPVIISNTDTDPRWIKVPNMEWVKSYLGMPILIKDKVIGLLNLDSVKANHFTALHSNRLQAFTNQMAVALQNASLFKEVNRRAEQLAIINRIGTEITSGLDLDKLLHRLQMQVQEAIPMDIFYIAFYDDVTGEMNIPIYYNIGELRKGTQRNLKEKGGLTGYVIRNRKTIIVPDLLDPDREPREEYILISEKLPRTYIGVPLISRGDVIGAISMQSYLPSAFSHEQIELFEIIATQAVFAIENARIYSRMQEMATTDVLTGLNNRRQFIQLAGNEVERSLRYHKKCSMIMIDIDGYKMINDTFGHGAGDRVLSDFGLLCSEKLRRMDICGRLGGDEFGLILPETDLPRAEAIAERLRSSFALLEINFNGSLIKVTASLGISQLKDKVKDLEALMETADQAMYLAKQAGKNQVAVYKEK